MSGSHVKLEDISVTFNQGTPNETTALDQVSLEVSSGEAVVILGGNGSGKSTLLKVIAGIILPTKGKVFIDGLNVTRKRDFFRARNISFVHQDPLLGTSPNLTLFENMVLAGKKSWWWPIPYTFQFRGVDFHPMEKIGLGLEKRFPLPLTSFSGGQRQAIAIGLTFSRNTRLLLLDEFTSSLDDVTSDKVFAMAFDHVEDTSSTLMMIVHDLDKAVSFNKRLIIFNKGKIVKTILDHEINNYSMHMLKSMISNKDN